jgi:hypothetical protein
MIANRKQNRSKMIRIIADVLDMSTDVSPLLAELFENTDLSHENLFGLREPPLNDKVEDETTTVLVEETEKITDTKEKIDTIITETTEIKPIKFYSGKLKDEIRFPIENGLITPELYEGIVKGNSLTENERLSVIFAIANCVFLSKKYPEKYPKFSSHLKSFKMEIFNTKELKLIRKYYRKISKSIT